MVSSVTYVLRHRQSVILSKIFVYFDHLSKFACISGLRPEEMPCVLSKMKNTIYEKNIRDIYVECLRAAGVAGCRRILLHP